MTDTQLPKLPDLGRGIYAHPTLGHLYDSMQVQQKMVAYAAEAVRAALAAQGEPVAWMVMNGICKYQLFAAKAHADALCAEMQKRHDLSGSLAEFHVQPLYTAPPAPAKPMTDAQPISNPDELPKGLVPLQREDGKLVYAACLDGGRYHGWLMWKHPDGQWVTKRKMTPLEVMQAEDQDHYGIVQEAGKENP